MTLFILIFFSLVTFVSRNNKRPIPVRVSVCLLDCYYPTIWFVSWKFILLRLFRFGCHHTMLSLSTPLPSGMSSEYRAAIIRLMDNLCDVIRCVCALPILPKRLCGLIIPSAHVWVHLKCFGSTRAAMRFQLMDELYASG